ncbi:aminotransferase class I/II-fold pyridoxal phosphate-dependent enzyme [Conexibacter sp. CPCC 206217]|uniref:aminotransferase class I/II-fold pyridoxal phosphate-dependent enzyme n=1 Tax=Conexibacter sp. CPCC 206217 TaxID=3064574 RepID=UPI002721B8B4|nr:aminotransferase class I/II-fold pyridoxal phosphate-dependent enzyme [Conexibacter sp. CPCC 206217]MDO8209465.1 aminotransferase class I/II-fold pyridoxal phosphate-dependent enzyme [Conexibacter sp. CPCC 206217]
MIEIEARLDELEQLGLTRRTRLVSGPQGPRVVLDGKPVLLLCSSNYLGLADHPAVREAAADAAMRWGVGAGGSRLVSGTMTIHRRLEERIAAFQRRQAALLFGSGYLASVGVVSALARPGDVVFSDEHNHAATVDGCRLSRADVFVYEHGDVEHLEWGLREAEGRGALIVTDGVFSLGGDVAPLPELVELAARYDVRLVVDEAHGLGTLGPGGRGAVAEAGCEDGVDVIVGSLGKALGSYGAYVACDQRMARYLTGAARSLIHSTAPSPPAVAGALAALSLLEEQPRRVEKLQSNAALLRAELSAAGFDVARDQRTPIVPLALGAPETAVRTCEKALERGVFAQPLLPPTVAAGTSQLRLAVMASHSKSELRDAARALTQAATAAGARPQERREAIPAPTSARAAAVVLDQDAPRARRAELWDDGEGELWVERRKAAPAEVSAAGGGGRPFDAELDGPPRPRAARDQSRADQARAGQAQGIFDVEAPGTLVEHAA